MANHSKTENVLRGAAIGIADLAAVQLLRRKKAGQ